jgi:hypothetical protein
MRLAERRVERGEWLLVESEVLDVAHHADHLRASWGPTIGHEEVGGQDTHHRVRLAVEDQRPPQDVGVGAEPSRPHGMAQDNYALATGLAVGDLQRAAPRRRHGEQLEEVPRHPEGQETLGRSRAGEGRTPLREARKPGDAL